MLEFSWKSTRGGTQYYCCNDCRLPEHREKQNRNVPNIVVKDGVLITDPDRTSNPHFCVDDQNAPQTEGNSLAKQYERCVCQVSDCEIPLLL